MKQSKNKERRGTVDIAKKEKTKINKTSLNAHANKLLILLFTVLCVAACLWVWMLGRRAQQVVTVVMSGKNLYKNEQITDLGTQIKAYDMTEIEFEKYCPQDNNGVQVQRIIRWDQKDTLQGAFVSYFVPQEVVLMWDMFTGERIKNTDTVLYEFPGKEILPLELGTTYLKNFRTYLETGDKINIECTYTEKTRVLKQEAIESGRTSFISSDYEEIEQVYTDSVFENIQIADILNSDGDSVLDLTMEYNNLTLAQQARYDDYEKYQQRLEPQTILLALTPQEKRQYYKYLAKGGTFRMSLPQRTE